MPNNDARSMRWWQVLSRYSIFEAADSGWSLVIVSLYFGTFVQAVLKQPGTQFGWATTVGALIIAVLSPVLGAAADHTGRRQPYLRFFVAGVVLFTAGIGFTRSVPVALILFILAYISVNGAFNFFNAMLPAVTNATNVASVVSMTVGVGYAGNLILLPAMGLLAKSDEQAHLVFLPMAIIYLLFAIPPMFFAPDFRKKAGARLDIGAAYRRIGNTVKEARKYKHLMRFLVADFLYENAVVSVIALMGLYARNVMGFAAGEVTLVFAPAILVAMLSAWFVFGPLVRRIGPKRAVLIDLAVWLLLFISALVIQPHRTWQLGPVEVTSNLLFKALVAPLAGMGLAGVWSSSRVLLTALVPVEKSGEFWGLYNLSGRTASVLGDLTWTLILSVTAESVFGYQLSIVALALYVVFGGILIATLPDVRPTEANFLAHADSTAVRTAE